MRSKVFRGGKSLLGLVQTDGTVSASQSPPQTSRTEWENESPGSISVAPLPTLLGTHSTPVLGLLLPRAETIYSEEWAQSQGKFLSLCKSKFQEALGWTPGSLPPSSCQPPPLREVGRMGLGWEQTGLPPVSLSRLGGTGFPPVSGT